MSQCRRRGEKGSEEKEGRAEEGIKAQSNVLPKKSGTE